MLRFRAVHIPGQFTLLLLMASMVMASIACSAGDLLAQREPTPVPTRIPAPTFTPTSDSVPALVVVTPAVGRTPGVIVVPPGVDPRSLIPIPPTATLPPTATYTPVPVAQAPATPITATVAVSGLATLAPDVLIPAATPPSPLATPTPSPTSPPTSTPTDTPTPFVLVQSGLVNLRTGPGPDYPLVAQLGPDIPVAVVGQNPEGTWYQICCVNGDSVWVARNHVQVLNDASQVFLVVADAPPTVTPTSTATETPTITPTPTATLYPFQIAEGPLYFNTNNEFLTIWAKIFIPNPGADVALPGYFLKVLFRNREDNSSFESRPNTKGEKPSTDYFEFNVPPGTASGNRVQFNYKFEFLPPDPAVDNPASTETRLNVIDGYWRVFVVDGSGQQVSNAVEFNTLLGNNNREIYIAWGRSP